MIYITGDTHGGFNRIYSFCRKHATSRDDILIILGDAGINYFGDIRDSINKQRLSELPITLFCIHGNHEIRPRNIDTYQIDYFHGGIVHYEQEYSNILFANDGQIYDLDGKKCLVIGGAYSVDKHYRIRMGMRWFEDEQPDITTKRLVELQVRRKQVDVILSHTCPFKYIPTEVFLPGIDQSTVDNSTEHWLDFIEEICAYQHWYCGHYHTDKTVDKLRFVFEDIFEFSEAHQEPKQEDEPLCNMCGKPLDEYDLQEKFGFEHYIGYGSSHDLEHVKARFCCGCFDKMLDQAVRVFKISPILGEYSLAGEVPIYEVIDELAEEAG